MLLLIFIAATYFSALFGLFAVMSAWMIGCAFKVLPAPTKVSAGAAGTGMMVAWFLTTSLLVLLELLTLLQASSVWSFLALVLVSAIASAAGACYTRG